jgi:hypothetical protein
MIARKNISTGPITQFWIRLNPRILKLWKTFPIFSYRTFAKGGYIIKIRPIAMGILVVPILNLSQKAGILGKRYPIPIPTAIDRKIQSVRKRSKNDIFFIILGSAAIIVDNYFKKLSLPGMIFSGVARGIPASAFRLRWAGEPSSLACQPEL